MTTSDKALKLAIEALKGKADKAQAIQYCKEALQSQNKELSDEELFNLVWKRKELVNEIVDLCELGGSI